MSPASDLVVVGGGHLGSAVARAAGDRRVLVASRTPRAHAGLWCRWAEGTPLPVADAHVCVALSPSRGEAARTWGELVPAVALAAWRDGAAAVTVCGPAGAGEPGLDAFERGMRQLDAAPRTTVLRFGALVGTDDGCLWPLVTALRAHGVARIPRKLPPLAPLLLADAARAVSGFEGRGGVHVLRGAETFTAPEIVTLLTERWGGRWAWRWFGGSEHLARLRAWQNLRDDWDDTALGPRRRLADWVEKLPGLRRKR